MTQSAYLKSVEILGLHGTTDLRVDLRPGLNVIYGRNGSGKTTLLHAIANLLDGDWDRFTFVRFEEIRITWAGGQTVSVHRQSHEDPRSVSILVDGEPLEVISRDQIASTEARLTLRKLAGGRPVYLPAFRSVLEAITRERAISYRTERFERQLQRIKDGEAELESGAVPDSAGAPARLPYKLRTRIDGVAYKTLLCRQWFGHFVPVVRFPSLVEAADQLADEYQLAELGLAQRDRAAFSEVFLQVIRTVFKGASVDSIEDTAATLASIRKNLESLQERSFNVPTVYNQLASLMHEQQQVPQDQEVIAARILGLYDKALQRRIRAQRDAFRTLATFESSVNRFLQGKSLKVGADESMDVRRPRARVRWEDGREANLSVLSSGERHVLTLLFSATHMPQTPGVFLIDEPELSLHVDWQRIILGELMKQVGDRQILACTHAPEVAAEHPDSMISLRPKRYVGPQKELFEPPFGSDDIQ